MFQESQQDPGPKLGQKNGLGADSRLRFDSALDAADAFGRLKGCGDKCISS